MGTGPDPDPRMGDREFEEYIDSHPIRAAIFVTPLMLIISAAVAVSTILRALRRWLRKRRPK